MSEVKVTVYLLVILFAVSSWVDMNGLWVELPVLVQELSEGWTLPSVLVVLTQAANIGPLLYVLVCQLFPRHRHEVKVIYSIIVIDVVGCLCVVLFWRQTSEIAGVQYSTALFICYFVIALVDCSSNLVFYPFMGNFKPKYTTAYFIGEGLSGFLPGLLGLAQGAGRIVCQNVTMYHQGKEIGDAHYVINDTHDAQVHSSNVSVIAMPTYVESLFSFEVFFSIVTVLVVMSGTAFTILAKHPMCLKEQISHVPQGKGDNPNEKMVIETDDSKMMKQVDQKSDKRNSWNCILLLLTAWVNALRNSVLLSIQSYACLPYGILTYHLAVTLGNIASPLACTFTLLIDVTSVTMLCGLSLIGSLLGAYIMAAAAMSPEPWLVGTTVGSSLIVAVMFCGLFVLGYVKMCLATLFRTEGKKGLFYCGAATQVGSAVGGVIMFMLVSVLSVFKSSNPCS